MNILQKIFGGKQVVVRMAPSPTGKFHVGTARTTLFNYLFAKKTGGKFILRIEDTDKERSTKEYEKNILDGIAWLGISYDEFYRQSEREAVYKKYIEKMLKSGAAYVSKEEPKEEGMRSEVIRLKNPNKKISFEDVIRGPIEFDTTELGDVVIAKSVDEPLYHLAVVIDDFESGVTHVIRGEDHISNTPRQILIQEAIGAPRPVYAHLPLILAPDRSKLSKRKHGESVSLDHYREAGYLPQAMVNYLALLGWNPGTEQEIFTMQELAKQFDLKKIQKGGAIFDVKKLDWVNKEHVKLLPEGERRARLIEEIKNEPYMKGEPELDVEKISWKDNSKEKTAELIKGAIEIIEKGDDLMAYAEREGKGDVLWPVRYSLTGAKASPDPITLIEIIGKEESLSRLRKAISKLV